jgi:hypothetical protein
MLGNLLGGLIDKEKITHDTIQKTLAKVATELECTHEELFIMIKPVNETFTMEFYIYRIEEKGPKFVRKIGLTEILGDSDDEDDEANAN